MLSFDPIRRQKEYQDVVNLQNNTTVHQMMSQGQYAQQMSKEQEEYMQALNKQEIHKKELEAATRQLEGLKQAMQPIQKESEDLKQLYDQQDQLLGKFLVVFIKKLYSIFFSIMIINTMSLGSIKTYNLLFWPIRTGLKLTGAKH